MPEEIDRILADGVSDYLFTPSADGVANLRAEGYQPEQVQVAARLVLTDSGGSRGKPPCW